LLQFGHEGGLRYLETSGNVDRPVYTFECEESYDGTVRLGMLPCGRYADWATNRRPRVGYEDPDIVLCFASEKDKVGKPILGVEFNDAIEAGNNAWQRVPRIVQAAERHVPFIYVIPTCDAEIKDGELRSIRHPNVIIQLAQLILMARYRTLSLTLFVEGAWHMAGLSKGLVSPQTTRVEGEKELAQLASALMIAAASKKSAFKVSSHMHTLFVRAMKVMLSQIRHFLSQDFTILEDNPAFTDVDAAIQTWWNMLADNADLPKEYRFYDWSSAQILGKCIPFKKITSTQSTYERVVNPALSCPAETRRGMRFASEWRINTSTYAKGSILDHIKSNNLCRSIPLSYKRGANEIAFIFNSRGFERILGGAYPSLEPEVVSHLQSSDGPILFLPIAGYVMDTGGPAFSRPDKGLVGLMRAVFASTGPFKTRIALLYSPLVPKDWKEQLLEAKEEDKTNYSTLTNNLWRELVRFATCVIVDISGSGLVL